MLANSLTQGKTHRSAPGLTKAMEGYKHFHQSWLSCFCCLPLLGQRILLLQKGLGKADGWALITPLEKLKCRQQTAVPDSTSTLKKLFLAGTKFLLGQRVFQLSSPQWNARSESKGLPSQKPGNQPPQCWIDRGGLDSWQISSPPDKQIYFSCHPTPLRVRRTAGEPSRWTTKA